MDEAESDMNTPTLSVDTHVQSSPAPSLVTVSALARVLRVSDRQVRRWCESGLVQATRTPGGHYRIPRSELERLRTPVAPAHPRAA